MLTDRALTVATWAIETVGNYTFYESSHGDVMLSDDSGWRDGVFKCRSEALASVQND
jgi:hypothetical protein